MIGGSSLIDSAGLAELDQNIKFVMTFKWPWRLGRSESSYFL